MKKLTVVIGIAVLLINIGLSGCTETYFKIENEAPYASIYANSTIGVLPLSVSFTSMSYDPDGTIEKYIWDFGDGNTSDEINPTYTYQNKGTYTVTLTVTDDDNATNFTSISIHIQTRQESEFLSWIYITIGGIESDIQLIVSFANSYDFSTMAYVGERLNDSIAGFLEEIDHFTNLSPKYNTLMNEYKNALKDYKKASETAILAGNCWELGWYDDATLTVEMMTYYIEDGNEHVNTCTSLISSLQEE